MARHPYLPTEFQIHTAFVQWIRTVGIPQFPELALGFHCPNGEARPSYSPQDRRDARPRYSPSGTRLKKLGVVAGVPDWLLPVARGSAHGLAIEFKRAGGRLSIEQQAYCSALAEQGWTVAVFTDWQLAAKAVESYMQSPAIGR